MEKRDLEIQTDGRTHTHDDYRMPRGSAHRGIIKEKVGLNRSQAQENVNKRRGTVDSIF